MTMSMVGGQMIERMFTGRGHNEVMNAAHLETMNYIRDIYLPFHFMTSAYSRYPNVFAKRSKKWQIIKARVVHHQRPNDWTGALRRSVLAESVTRSTATRGTLTAKAPMDSVIKSGKSAGKRIRRPLTDQRRLEMEHVSEHEVDEQGRRQLDQYMASVHDPKYQDKVLKQFR